MADGGDGPLGGDAPVEVDEVITCIDCGGRAHLLSYPPNEGTWQPGDLITYRCEDCLDRWDLIVPGAEEDDAGA